MSQRSLAVVSNFFYHFRRLKQIRRVGLVGKKVTARLVSAFILPRLDYCNALLAGLRRATTDPLQRVQNAAARLKVQKLHKSAGWCHWCASVHAANSRCLNVMHCSDTLLSRSVAGKLFHTAGPLYAKLRCATDVSTAVLAECTMQPVDANRSLDGVNLSAGRLERRHGLMHFQTRRL